MTTDKYIISPKLRNELEGFGKGYDKALEDVEKIINEQVEEISQKMFFNKTNKDYCSYLQVGLNVLKEFKQQLKQMEKQ